jgi:tetratricopeptide (TPR) repeat protein
MLGRFHEATDAIEHGIRIAERIEHRPTLAACLFYLGLVVGWRGELENSLASFERAEAISDELGDMFRLYMIHGWRGQAHVWAEKRETAEDDLVRARALANQIGTTFLLGAFTAYLAEVRLHTGDVAQATKLCREALQIATETHQPWSLGIASRTLAACLLAADPPDVQGAESAIQEAIAIQQDRGLLVELACSLTVCGRVLNAKGDRAGAKVTFARAAGMFEDMGMTKDLARARDALAELER